MINNKKTGIVLLCMAIVAFVLPFIILGFYYRPHSDDFLFANLKNEHGWWGLQKWLYLNWGGRFSSTALIGLLNPLNYKNYDLFSIHAPLGIIVFCPLLYWLGKNSFGKTLVSRDLLLLVGYTTVTFFFIMPGISDGVYWFTGFMLYFLSILLFIIWLMNFEKMVLNPGNTVLVAATSIIGIILVGFNEVILVVCITTLVLTLSSQIIFFKKIRKDILAVLFFVLAAALFEIAAPGNFKRVASVKGGLPRNIVNMFYSTFALGTSGPKMIIDLVKTSPLIPFCILAITIFTKAKAESERNYFLKVSPFFTIVASALVYYSSIFPGVYAGLGNYGRTLNVSFFIFLLGIILSLYHLVIFYSGRFKTVIAFIRKNNNKIQLACIIVSIPFFIRTNNYSIAIDDLLSGRAKQSFELMNERSQILENSRNKDSVTLRYIDPCKLPATIYNPSLADEKNEYNKPKLEEYYNVGIINYIEK